MVPPDMATITIALAAKGATPVEAASHLASRADSLRRALATLGIPGDSIVNRSRWSWWGARIETIAGPTRWIPGPPGRDDGLPTKVAMQDTTYRIHDALEVRIRDLHTVGAVLDTVLGRGLTDMSDVTFSLSDVTAAQDDALRLATVRAHRQAEVIAAASNLQLGRTLSLSTQADNTAQSRYGWSPNLSLASAAPEGSPTIVVAPAVPVSVSVYGMWELVPK